MAQDSMDGMAWLAQLGSVHPFSTAQHSRILTAKAADVDRGCNGGASVPALCSIAVTSGSIHSGGTAGWVIPRSPAAVRPTVAPNAIEPIPASFQAIVLIAFMCAQGQCADHTRAPLLSEVGLGELYATELD